MKKMKIGMRLTVSFAIILAFMVLSAAFSAFMMKKMSDDNDAIYATRVEPLELLSDANAYFNRTATNIRQVFISRNDAEAFNVALEKYESEKALLLSALQDFKKVVDENPNSLPEGEKRIADTLAKVQNEYLPIAENIVSLVKSDKAEEARSILLSSNIRTINSETTTMVSDLFSFNMGVAAAANQQQTTDSNRTIMIVVVISAISAIISLILAGYLRRSITKPIDKLKGELNEIVNGNLDVDVASNSPDEIGELTRDTRKLVDTLRLFISDMGNMAQEHTNGEVDARMDETRFNGSYRTMAQGVNKMVADYVEVLESVLDCLGGFSAGDFDKPLVQFPGKKAKANVVAEGLRTNLKSVNQDVSTLIGDAIRGKLSTRADAAKYKGGWAGIISGLNELMDAVVAPIQEAAAVMQQVSVGNFDQKVTGNYQGDFLLIKNSINDTITNIASYIDEISEVLGAMSRNDLDQEITREYVGKFSDIKNALNNIIDTLNSVVSDITSAAEQVNAGAKQISESSMTLAQGASEQASAVEELNATILTINESTKQNAENAQTAKSLSDSSKNNASKGDQDMNSMLTSMQGINESSNSISKIIKVIDDIAFQTNLLALNAAVEAARAGVHGKGFAVVAEEVRTLASRSQNAARETADLIEESISRVNGGTKIADTTANTLQTIVGDVTKVADIIANIAEASGEQAYGIGQVTEGLSQIAEVVQSNSATSEESASASQQLSSQAEVMNNLVSAFNLRKKYK